MLVDGAEQAQEMGGAVLHSIVNVPIDRMLHGANEHRVLSAIDPCVQPCEPGTAAFLTLVLCLVPSFGSGFARTSLEFGTLFVYKGFSVSPSLVFNSPLIISAIILARITQFK